MGKKKRILLFFALLFVLLGVKSVRSKAENSNIGFSVKPILEEHQIYQDIGYWWIKPTKEMVTLEIQVINGNQENSFELSANQAITNQNFVVDYGQEIKMAKNYLIEDPVVNFEKMVAFGEEQTFGKKQITLQPNETITIPITLYLPKNFQGTAIGGINITRMPTMEEEKESLVNLYNYAFALVVESEETSTQLPLKLSIGNIEKDNQSVEIINPSQTLLRDVRIKATLQNKKGEEMAIIDSEKGTIVPKGKITFPMQVKAKLKKNEQYSLKILAEAGETYQKEYQFEVNEDGVVQVIEKQERTLLKSGVASFLCVGATLLVSCFIYQNKNYGKEGKAQ